MHVTTRALISVVTLSSAIGLFGCATTATGPTTDSLFVQKTFHAPIGTPLTAQTGDSIFVEGQYIEGQKLTLSRDMHLLIPGSMHIPFPVSIDAGLLRMTRIGGNWKYFCASPGHATASFPGLGSVIRAGDCVGVRQALGAGTLEWVVDNSNYNHMQTIWHRDVSKAESGLLAISESKVPFSYRQLTRIVFDGFYGGEYHFTYDDWQSPTAKDSKDFLFDRSPQGSTTVGIHGKVFRIMSANNVQMTYEWVKL